MPGRLIKFFVIIVFKSPQPLLYFWVFPLYLHSTFNILYVLVVNICIFIYLLDRQQNRSFKVADWICKICPNCEYPILHVEKSTVWSDYEQNAGQLVYFLGTKNKTTSLKGTQRSRCYKSFFVNLNAFIHNVVHIAEHNRQTFVSYTHNIKEWIHI